MGENCGFGAGGAGKIFILGELRLKYSFGTACIRNSGVQRRNKGKYGDSGCARMTTPVAAALRMASKNKQKPIRRFWLRQNDDSSGGCARMTTPVAAAPE
jgi:hypothetical protein